MSDKGFGGVVIKIALKGIKFLDKGNRVLLSAGAGEIWDDVVAKAVGKNLGGIENLSLIPGTAGAALYQNIGAYGSELKDVFESAEVFDVKSGRVRRLFKKDCKFGYRDTVFQHKEGDDYVILSVNLVLAEDAKPRIVYPDLIKYFADKNPTIAEVRKAVIKIRKAKLVYPGKKLGTAGSFFKNPVISISLFNKLLNKYPDIKGRKNNSGLIKLYAAQLIEKAGWKGQRLGKVGISEKHALVLVNYGGGKAKEIFNLARKVTNNVYAKFGVKLEPEVKVIS